MDQQPAGMPTEPIHIQPASKKPRRKYTLIFVCITLILFLVAGVYFVLNAKFNDEPELQNELISAEQYIYKGNNAASEQDKLKAYNQAKDMLYTQGDYARVVSMYKSAYEKADDSSKYYAYFPYYLADAYFRNGQLTEALTIQERFISTYDNAIYIHPVPEASAVAQLKYFQDLQKSTAESRNSKPKNSVY